ncbi:MAG TPA: hypothetical protein VKB21_00420, partial [Candidatus Acidoferrum sp.]|nr:hypothetical protein [Candidatus Acidoferrum sp.]
AGAGVAAVSGLYRLHGVYASGPTRANPSVLGANDFRQICQECPPLARPSGGEAVQTGHFAQFHCDGYLTVGGEDVGDALHTLFVAEIAPVERGSIAFCPGNLHEVAFALEQNSGFGS